MVPNVIRPENEQVIAYIRSGGRGSKESPLLSRIMTGYMAWISRRAPQISKAEPNSAIGHPDLTQRWHQLASSLQEDCGFKVYGTSAFVHPHSGIIFALAGGQVYYLRLPPDLLPNALDAGARTTYADFSFTDPRQDLGEDWVYGWQDLDIETKWCQAAYEYFGKHT